MYEHRFGLHRKPFQSTLTEKDFPLLNRKHTAKSFSADSLRALQSDLGVAVLTGPAGFGKTVTSEYLPPLLQADSQTVFRRGAAVRSNSDQCVTRLTIGLCNTPMTLTSSDRFRSRLSTTYG